MHLGLAFLIPSSQQSTLVKRQSSDCNLPFPLPHPLFPFPPWHTSQLGCGAGPLSLLFELLCTAFPCVRCQLCPTRGPE